jgi:hypothetical protein
MTQPSEGVVFVVEEDGKTLVAWVGRDVAHGRHTTAHQPKSEGIEEK